MSQYLDVFLDEGREQIALLEANVLEMERGNHTKEILQSLFRAAHTLKGSSRAMGFLSIGDLTHEMENILDDLRNDVLAVTTPIVDALLDCLDSLGKLVNHVAETGSDADFAVGETQQLVAKLNSLRTNSAAVAVQTPVVHETTTTASSDSFVLAVHEQAASTSAIESGFSVYMVNVDLSTDCMMKSVRVWMAFGAVEPLGTVIATDPSEEKLESEEFGLSFRFLFATTNDVETVRKALLLVSEVVSCDIAIHHQAQQADNLPGAPPVEVQHEHNVTPDKPVAGPKTASSQSPTIRVEVSRLDTLLNLVGELVIERSQVHQICADLHNRYPRDQEAAQLLETTHRIARVTAELQDQIMKTRMLPVDGVFQRLPRMVRDLAQKTNKDIRFEMVGGETELDRTVLESLGDPLIHLLRNSVDHGIELPEERRAAGKSTQGLVTLCARHEENRIVIQISDDGRGMDPVNLKHSAVSKGLISAAAAETLTERDAIHLIFASGFSTASALTDISGRGVGMDIVKSNLEKIGGRIAVESKPGKGSEFTIHLPMTLAIVRAVLVRSTGGTYALPLGSVVEMLRLGCSEGEVEKRILGARPVISLRGSTVPLVNLSDLLSSAPLATVPDEIKDEACVVVVGLGERQIGICVDELVGEQEVVIKSMGTLLGDIPGLSGATILGDGQIALIVDVTKAAERVQASGWKRHDNLVAC